MSKGAFRVGVEFNPSNSHEINTVKQNTAVLIDMVEPIRENGGEAGRCAAIAQTKFEEAAMWAVKAITKPTEN